ncbi:reticulon-4 isoform X2 [Antechinus flavipes]|uniref:reticulon-4 isoform X1 n=1 Tax=Antechinus flavipes TaxID=38775 RepID=UPI002235A350|nr:reticulon-4 isoform X1 [Antechinus flavipes]XP_051831238.1 reticulon-4 isoform X2 [Antechinus flavipes]
MEDLDQSPLVSSSSGAAAGPARPQPEFKYQFVREPEDEDEEEEEEEDEDEDLEELEVLERKPAAGMTAVPLPANAAAADAPLLDFENESVPPAPRGPLPAVPPAAAERQPRWDPSPVSSSSPSPPPSSSVAAASLEEDEPPSRPPPPPPTTSVDPHPDPAPPAWTPSTPAPAAPPSTPAAPKRRGSSGSADETLFALPASSEPVMHSSAEKVMNLKEQPGSTLSAGQEELTSVLLETAASLPSLSPLSAAPFKEHESFGNFPAVLSTEETHQTTNEISKESTEKAKNPFVDSDFRGFSELRYSEMGSSFEGLQKAELSFKEIPQEEIFMKKQDKQENLVSETLRQCQQDLPLALIKSEEKDKVIFSEKTKCDKDNIGEREVIVPSKEEAPLREEYVDFKPFEQVWKAKDTYNEKSNIESFRGNLDSKLESIVDEKYVADSLRKKNHDKDSESSNEDNSFPSTPEAIKDVSQAYASFEPEAVTENLAKKGLSLLEDQTSENKTDEKKIAEKQAQIVTESNSIKTTNPFIVSAQDRDRDYVSTDSLSKVPVEVGASIPEGLTPDLVQEAHESKISDATSTKLVYETKMDLVQMSESLQEPVHSVAQLCPSFEKSEATPSPVLPDIVMEAPLNSVTPGASASAAQLSSSPLEAFTPVNYESLKLESENPPPYEDSMNILSKDIPAIKEEKKGPECISPIVEETEASYISIACDLIKETKLSTESASADFTDYSEMAVKENVSQPMPDLSDLVEDSSPESEPVDLFSDDSIPEVPQKEDEAVLLERENLMENSPSLVTEHESKEKLNASPPTMGKPYLESFQPILDTSKAATALSSEVTFTVVNKEKIPLQMEELNTAVYSDEDFFVSKEPKIREAELFADSSPIQIVEDFSITVSSKTVPPAKLAREFTDVEVSPKGENGSYQEVVSSSLCSELPHDLSLKNVPIKAEEKIHVLHKAPDGVSQDMPDGSKGLSLPTNVSVLPTNAEIGSIVKPKVILKEAEDKKPSVTEKEKRAPSAIFSAELSKTSVVDLLYWRDIKKTGVVFGASLFLLLSLTVFSIVSVTAYIALALLSVTISFRVYKGVIQAIQKSDEGHPFRAYLDSEVAISETLVQKYSKSALGHVNCTIKELRRLFLVDDLVDSLKFAVLMWIFTYVGALFNGLTLLILALISLFSVPVIYERHQTQIDHYLELVNKNVKDAMAKIQAKIPGLKCKAE